MANKIYTKTGDKGSTSLLGGTRVSKDDWRMEATGNLDELSSVIGLIPYAAPGSEERLNYIQTILFNMMSIIGTDEEKFDITKLKDVTEDDVKILELWIDEMETELPPLKNFILPKNQAHFARTVCRRVERRMLGFKPEYLMYLNRLSDFLFVFARFLEFKIWENNGKIFGMEFKEETVSQL